MNFFETQDFFKKMFPDKLVTFTFDENCVRQLECIMTDGLPNIMHHAEYNKVKVSVDGMPDQYVPIQSHRMNLTWATYKSLITSKNEVHIHPDQIKTFKEVVSDDTRKIEYDTMIKQFSEMSGMSQEAIEQRIKG